MVILNILIAMTAGCIAGWLVNYFSDVLPTQRRLSKPICTYCQAEFNWQDYLLMRPCRNCNHKRAWRTVIVLIAAIIVSVIISFNNPPKLGYWLSLLMLTYFGVVLVIDLEHRLILHPVSVVGAGIALVTGILNNGVVSTVVGGLVGLVIMLAFYLFGMLFARYRARKLGTDDGEEALGFGDVILAGVLGLMLGWPQIYQALVIAILAGGLVSLAVILVLSAMRRFESMNVFTAYGPYLILGATLLIFFPQTVSFFTGK
jgi:leader peptidase (prepilin peptidase) / N-methyltransferase